VSRDEVVADVDDVGLALAAGRRAEEGEAYLLLADGRVVVVGDPASPEARVALTREGRPLFAGVARGVACPAPGGVS
jgi:hypothetical protein